MTREEFRSEVLNAGKPYIVNMTDAVVEFYSEAKITMDKNSISISTLSEYNEFNDIRYSDIITMKQSKSWLDHHLVFVTAKMIKGICIG